MRDRLAGLMEAAMANLCRLLALLAVLLMPLGMQPAAAAPAQHHAAIPVQHCPEPAPGHDMKGGMVECTMACSAALPAADWPLEEPLRIASAPIEPTAVHVLYGLHLDPATPPPKHS